MMQFLRRALPLGRGLGRHKIRGGEHKFIHSFIDSTSGYKASILKSWISQCMETTVETGDVSANVLRKSQADCSRLEEGAVTTVSKYKIQ